MRHLYWILKYEWARLVCRIKGHRIVDLSSIGPESGIEHLACTRCGWEFEHIYY